MVTKVSRVYSKEEVLGLLDPLLRTWFTGKFSGITEPQAYAVPLIHARRNVLISSPTGSGKTLTAFLSIINELYGLQRRGELEDRIYAVYISPLKALANDINRNLTEPLREMGEVAVREGHPPPLVRVAVRSGDTSQQERQRQARKPPHIYITTPESLAIVLSAPKFREKLSEARWIIVDEIHEICSSKRGTLLSLGLERLQAQVKEPLTRIGLSATIAPIEEVAKFLAGYEGGKLRQVDVVEVEAKKSLDLAVVTPVRDITAVPMEVANARMYDALNALIDEHRTTLVFTNTRSGTEHVSFKLKERGVENLEAHHGSLSKVTRLDVEERLKAGKLKAAVSSTSLELGIDIGYIDLVCQIGSPKSIAKGLQRIGRAGHAYGETAVGRLIVFEPWDLVECATLVQAAYAGKIDRVDIPRNCLDVLAQALVGMSLEKRWDVEDAFRLVRRSHPYHDLPREEFDSVLNYLASRSADMNVYAKVWFDEAEGRFGRRRGTQFIYFTNVGTIPEEGSYHVFSERGTPLGELSEKFVENLRAGDIFVLGGRTYQFERARGTTVFVKDASGRRPTVPSWSGEMLPRSFDLSLEVGRYRRDLAQRIAEHGEETTMQWLLENQRMDLNSARSIVSYLAEQTRLIADLPTDRQILLEGYIDGKGNRNLVFHACFGRRVNDALSRAYAFALTEKLQTNTRVSVTDDNFMITVPRRVSLAEVPGLVTPDTLEDLLRRSVRTTELFKQRFRHCATRSFMVLRNYKGREVSILRQQLRSQRVLDYLHEMPDFPVIVETYREILNEVMDLPHAREVLKRMATGEIVVKTSEFSAVPSPFAHNVVLLGVSDVVLMEDRSAMLRALHRQVLKRVIPEEELAAHQFEEADVAAYFERKWPAVQHKEDVLDLLERGGAMNLLQQRGRSIYDRSRVPFGELRKWAGELFGEGRVQSIWTPKGILQVLTEDVPLYAAVYAKRTRLSPPEAKVLKALDKRPMTAKVLAKSVKIERARLNEILRKLERSFQVHRRGVEEATFVARTVPRGDLEKALDTLLVRHLEVEGPTTVEELSVALDLDSGLVEEALRGLEGENVVASGHFVVGEDYQYLLTRDVQRLQRKDDKRPLVDEGTVRAYLVRKHLTPHPSLDAYFDRYGAVGMTFDLFNHVAGFSHEDWLRRREAGEILEGRFLGGRVRYVRAKDVPLFVSAYRRPPESELERKALDLLRKTGALDQWHIAKRLGVERERAKEALDGLDRNLQIYRKFYGQDGWTAPNHYAVLATDETVPDARERMVRQALRHAGPATFEGLKEATRIRWDELESHLEKLESAGTITRFLVTGSSEAEMFVLTEELEDLKATPSSAKHPLTILSLLDPYVEPLWAQVASQYGEGWFYPLVKDGRLAGVIEMWEMSGAVEIREVDLADEALLPEFLAAVDRMMEYYGQRGFEICRLTRALKTDLADLDLKPFLKAGWHRFGDFLAKGNFEPVQFEHDALIAYILRKQGVARDTQFDTVLDAAAHLGGLRYDYNVKLRVKAFESLQTLQRKGILVRGQAIPPFTTYCTEEDLRLYKAAKQGEIDEDMATVLKIIVTEGPLSRRRLEALSPLDPRATAAALRKLQRALQVTKDEEGRFLRVQDSRHSGEAARRVVLERIVRAFGLFTAENLSAYTKHEYGMGEVRRLLREFEREGWLAKGFFARGERTVHWALRGDLPSLGKEPFQERFVLTPLDNLHVYFRGEIERRYGAGYVYVVFDGPEMVAAFKAKRHGWKLSVTEFLGDERGREILREWQEGTDVEVEDHVNRVSDAEVQDWYEKMYSRKPRES